MSAEEFTGHLPITPRVKKTLVLAKRIAVECGHNYIGTEHVVMALFEMDGIGAQILIASGANKEKAEAEWARIRNPIQAQIDALKAKIAELEGK